MGIWETVGQSDEWYTPKYIFDALGECFDLDVAAAPEGRGHVPAKAFIRQLSLLQPWHGFVWMNPPFGGRNGIDPWLRRFVDHGNGIGLAPDRTSAGWFQRLAPQTDAMLFLPKVKFDHFHEVVGDTPPHGTVLFAIGDRAAAALLRAGRLGVAMKPCKEPN